MFEFLGKSRTSEMSQEKIECWNEFLQHEDIMLNLFDGTHKGRVKVTQATKLMSVGTFTVSLVKAKILSKLYSSDENALNTQVDRIQNETLSMLIESELNKVRNSRS